MSDTETSPKRAEANRRNAQKSTGPRSAAGRERARFNALKHGMRAKTVVLPGEDADAFNARLEAWTINLDPRDDVERFLVRRAVQLSWQLERADRAIAAGLADARTAETDRLAERADEVAALGRRLLWDPRGPTCFYPQFETTIGQIPRVSWSGKVEDPADPARLLIRLEATALGCAWLLDRWGELREALERYHDWQPPDRFKAIRLLGRQPLDVWEDDRVMDIYMACGAVESDPDGPSEFQDVAHELHAGERKRFVERINDRRAARRLAGPEAGEAALLVLVSEEEQRLEELLAEHLEREEASGGVLEFDASDAGERLRRYQASCDRTLLRVLEALRKRRRDAEGAASKNRQSSRQTKEGAPDPAHRIAGLLSLLAVAKGAGATNEAKGPDDPSGRGTAEPARDAGIGPASPTETEAVPPATNDANRPAEEGRDATNEAKWPTVEDGDVTNEANGPSEGPGLTGRCLPVAILALIALILCAGITAAFAAPAGAIGRESSSQRPRIPEGSCRSSLGLPASGVKESRDDLAFRLRSRR